MALETMERRPKKTADAPADVTPLMVKTVVSVKATVPLVQYGNLEMFVSTEIHTRADEPDSMRDSLISATLIRLQGHLVDQIVPMAEAVVERDSELLLREANPDAKMQRDNPMYRWVRVAAPNRKLEAMEAIIHDESRLALVSKSRVK